MRFRLFFKIIVAVTCLLVTVSKSSGLDGVSKVISLQESFVPNTSSYAKWLGNITRPLTDFTICYRIKIFYYRPEVTVFSYMNNKGHRIITDHNCLGMQLAVTATHYRLSTTIVTPLMQWSSFCIAISPDEPATVFFNGEKAKNVADAFGNGKDTTRPPKNTVLLETNGTVVVGQEQDVPTYVYDAAESLSGAVTDMNVWSRRLREDEMAAISGCLTRGKGDILDWDTSDFEIGLDSSISEMELIDTCDIVPRPYFMFPSQLQFIKGVRLCRAFGGEMAAPKNLEEQMVVHSLAEKSKELCSHDGDPLTWLGLQRNKTDDTWHYLNSKEDVTFFNWAEGQPDKEEEENCIVLKGYPFQGAWADQSCRETYKVCVLCALEMPVLLRFRGICDSTLYDDRFAMIGTRNGKPYFRGYYRSHIYYTDRHTWRLENIMTTTTFAEMHSDGSLDFPIGRHVWEFSHGFCGREMLEEHSLTLSQCSENGEFTCDDGTCILMEEVCDRRTQCQDRSDEIDCSIVKLPPGYQSTLPPPSPSTGSALPVYLNISLRSFVEIDAINNKFEVEMVVRMLWKDERIRFKHLHSDRQLNIILPSEAENIWVPTIDFLNADGNRQTIVDKASKITIERLGTSLPDDIENSKEAQVYEGRDNYIRNSRKYSMVFLCNFNFFYYPFNTDYCSMIFRVNKITETYVILEKYGSGTVYEGGDLLAEYAIGGITTKRYENNEAYSGIETLIQMRHLFTTQLVTIFIPTTLINIISFATFSFKWFDFQNRIMVSLTALLVLCTLFSQISDNLPKTSYFKLIDVWFFNSILYTFLTIMTHTLVEYTHHYNSNVDPNPKSSLSSFIPIKVAPASVSDKEIKSQIKDEKFKTRWGKSMPEFINMVGYTLILSTYLIFFLVFWGIAFSQKIMEDAKKNNKEYEVMTGYPE